MHSPDSKGSAHYQQCVKGLLACLSAFCLLLFTGFPGHAEKQPKATPHEPPTMVLDPALLPGKTDMLIGVERFHLEVARTPEEMMQGLMHRKKLARQTGMLFPLIVERKVSFWMKNTLIPLDMIFIRNYRVVHIQENAQPCTADPCPTFSSRYPVDMVVELAGGSASRYGIETDTPVAILPLEYPAATLMKKGMKKPTRQAPTPD
ncbi:MAG: DUF192 domain-containing protein [Candidatus Melainabacteria bacterium]